MSSLSAVSGTIAKPGVAFDQPCATRSSSRSHSCARHWRTPRPGPARAGQPDLRRHPGARSLALAERLQRYLDSRRAAFLDWLPDGGMLVATRFGDTEQVHRVAAPLGMREQLTFYPEPISVAAAPQVAKAEGFVFLKDQGGNENAQIYYYKERRSQRPAAHGRQVPARWPALVARRQAARVLRQRTRRHRLRHLRAGADPGCGAAPGGRRAKRQLAGARLVARRSEAPGAAQCLDQRELPVHRRCLERHPHAARHDRTQDRHPCREVRARRPRRAGLLG